MAKDKKKYCICKKPYDGTGFMIACDSCDIWYHGRCVNLTAEDGKSIDKWFCAKCKEGKVRCDNPGCVFATRSNSKYCSDECGFMLNRFRYEKIFLPKWNQLSANHSTARIEKMRELKRLDEEKGQIIELIGNLKEERNSLEEIIRKIKSEATRLYEANSNSRDKEDDDSDDDNDEREETTTSDLSKTFCIICGITILSDNAFKHWAACHKKQESQFNFTSDIQIRLSCPSDQNPELYCQKQDKKTKRYCMNLKSACPQHYNWHEDKNDRVCGCPLTISQELAVDGNYCLELKKDCNLHYNWDKFRLATKDMERVQAFARFDALQDRLSRVQASLNDTYGGVIGVMTHNTIDHCDPGTSYADNLDDVDVDIEMD